MVDVHELETNFVRIGFFERGQHIAQTHFIAVAEVGIPSLAVEIRFGQAELRQAQARVAFRLIFERIDVGLGVAERPVVVDQGHHPAEKREISFRGGSLGRRGGSRSGGGNHPIPRFQLGHAQLKTLEKSRPRRVHGARVFTPLGVLGLHHICILPSRNRRVHEKWFKL